MAFLRLNYLCVLLPLGSPTAGPKALFSVWHGPVVWCGGEGVRVRVGMGTGIRWVDGWAIPGTTQAPTDRARKTLMTAKRARKALQGPGVVVMRVWARAPGYGGGDGSWTTPAGPGRALWALPVQDPHNAASGPIRRDSTSILLNLVKTAECHQNITKRPVMLPISKTGPRCHLLKFLEIRFR